MSKIIVIDGNSLLFRAFYATYYDPSNIMRTKSGQATNAIFAFSNMITSLLTSLKKGDGIFVGFDAGKHTFRHQEYKDYKANRPELPKDLITQFPIARELLDKLNIVHYECDNLEADDICGIIANKAQKEGYKVYIYTSDKDYLQLIDENITIELIKKGLKDIKEMTPQTFKEEWGFEPIQITDYKGLRGDDSDNLKGIPGVGDKTAKQLISQFGDLESIIQNADTKTKVGRNIIEFQDNGRMCKHLAIIAKDQEIPIGVNETIYNGYKFNSVSEFANKYEFKSLVSKLPKLFKQEEKHNEKVDFCEVFDSNGIDFDDKIGIDVDIENVNYHDAVFNGLAFTASSKTYYISKANLLKDEKLLSILKNPDIKKFAFDFKKVRYVLAKNNIEVNGLFFDLILASYLIDSSIKNDIESVLNYYSIDISYATTKNLLFDDSTKQISIATSFYSIGLFEEIKEKKARKWYQKGNFILTVIGLVTVLASSFIASIGETSGYSVSIRDFTLTKAMTEEYNAGEENAVLGHNYVIDSDVLTYAVTEYKPKVASQENPLPVIFVMPGFTRTKATMAQYCIELSKRNAVVYSIDPG